MDSAQYDAVSTGLILIDVLNDFLADDGKLNTQIGEMRDKLDLRSQLARLLEGARGAGVKTFYAPHGLDEHSFDDLKYVHPTFQGGLAHQLFWKGSYGADFYEPLRPAAGDVVVSRHRMYDSFRGTDLDDLLRENRIEKVVFAGLTSQTCVEGTGRHALEAGYHVTFLTDAVAEFTEEAHRAAIDISYPRFGHVVSTIDEFLAGIRQPGLT
ncbi:isochorismatase family cysteine hydrolase [Kribbella ginsengisoli]|uniref:Cysteine hydrolase n=1 Tax=Kribbella ginsengisoli TaxID=363865 RepID=A0ABP6W6P2_9ACTN